MPNNTDGTTNAKSTNSTNLPTIENLTEATKIVNDMRRRLVLLAASYIKTLEFIMADATRDLTQEQREYIATLVEEQGYYLDRSYQKVDPVSEEDRHIYKTIP